MWVETKSKIRVLIIFLIIMMILVSVVYISRLDYWKSGQELLEKSNIKMLDVQSMEINTVKDYTIGIDKSRVEYTIQATNLNDNKNIYVLAKDKSNNAQIVQNENYLIFSDGGVNILQNIKGNWRREETKDLTDYIIGAYNLNYLDNEIFDSIDKLRYNKILDFIIKHRISSQRRGTKMVSGIKCNLVEVKMESSCVVQTLSKMLNPQHGVVPKDIDGLNGYTWEAFVKPNDYITVYVYIGAKDLYVHKVEWQKEDSIYSDNNKKMDYIYSTSTTMDKFNGIKNIELPNSLLDACESIQQVIQPYNQERELKLEILDNMNNQIICTVNIGNSIDKLIDNDLFNVYLITTNDEQVISYNNVPLMDVIHKDGEIRGYDLREECFKAAGLGIKFKNVTFGDSTKDIISELGQPNKIAKNGEILKYTYILTELSQRKIEFIFNQDKLERIFVLD